MAVLTSNPVESLLCLLVEAFLPLELTKTLRPAEHQATGTGCTTFASGSLGVPLVIVRGATPIFWTRESWPWEKKHRILDTDSEHVQAPRDPCPSPAGCYHLAVLQLSLQKPSPLFCQASCHRMAGNMCQVAHISVFNTQNLPLQ